jgi:hypothetical protein
MLFPYGFNPKASETQPLQRFQNCSTPEPTPLSGIRRSECALSLLSKERVNPGTALSIALTACEKPAQENSLASSVQMFATRGQFITH